MSLAFRAYFALPDTLKTSAGVTTNAVHGFASMVLNLVKDHQPSALAVAFDLPGGTFRDEIVDDYKGGRDETPADLPPQFEMIRDVLHALAIPVVEAEGFEADDVLATLASEARDRGHPVIIVTGDRDSYQLVEDPYIRVLYNRRGVSDYALYDEAGIEERTGVLPPKYPLLAALRGDPSDNLPGVPGVGEKTAAKLINEYGDLDTLYAHLDALSPKLRQNLAEHVERVRKNAEVIPLVRDVPLDVDVDDLVLGGWDLEEARAAFASLEMKGAWTRFESAMRDGLLGAPGAGGYGGGGGAWSVEGGGPEAEAPPVGPEDGPAWLAAPTCAVPADVDGACSDLEDLFAAVRSGTGNVALAAGWEGDAGRTPLLALALVVEAAAGDARGRPPGGRAPGAGDPGVGARAGRRGCGGPRRQGADADPPAPRRRHHRPRHGHRRGRLPARPVRRPLPPVRPGTPVPRCLRRRRDGGQGPGSLPARGGRRRGRRDRHLGTRSHRTGRRAPGGRAGPPA
jgi:DNA polymerase-1